jgi:hypothetical protein
LISALVEMSSKERTLVRIQKLRLKIKSTKYYLISKESNVLLVVGALSWQRSGCEKQERIYVNLNEF